MIVSNKSHNEGLHEVVKRAFSKLKQLREENNQWAFNDAMRRLLPGVRKYISRWLNHAIKNDKIHAGKYKVEDFVNELYILAYDHFHEVGQDSDLYGWLFKQANKLLEDAEVEDKFDDFFFKTIDSYTKAEWEEMEEKFSTDGDGDFVMEEELDDISYVKNDYLLKDVFIEDQEQELIEKISNKISTEQINRHVNMLLHYLPSKESAVFDLVARHRFKPDEITRIKEISMQEVEKHLENARNFIRVSFKNRFIEN